MHQRPPIQWPILYQQSRPAPATTSPEPATTLLHQQIPVMHQRPPIQWPILYQQSRPAPATRSCSDNHHPAAATFCRTLFLFMISHNKVWPFKEKPLVLTFLPSSSSIVFQKFAGPVYLLVAATSFFEVCRGVTVFWYSSSPQFNDIVLYSVCLV